MKPFKGILLRDQAGHAPMLNQPFYGLVVKHMDQAPGEGTGPDWMEPGHRVKTSTVKAVHMFDRFDLVETHNSFYVVLK